MAWQQLHLQCEKANVDLAEALLLEAGALSIALDDAGEIHARAGPCPAFAAAQQSGGDAHRAR